MNSGNIHKTFKKFNGKTFMLDEFSYSGISKSDAEKRKEMWKKSGLGARLIKKANGRYVIYREYYGDMVILDESSLFPEGRRSLRKPLIARLLSINCEYISCVGWFKVQTSLNEND